MNLAKYSGVAYAYIRGERKDLKKRGGGKQTVNSKLRTAVTLRREG